MYHLYAVDEGIPCRIDISEGTRNFVKSAAKLVEGVPVGGIGIRIPFKPLVHTLGGEVLSGTVEAYVRRNPSAGWLVEEGWCDEVSYSHPDLFIDFGYFDSITNDWVSYHGVYPTILDEASEGSVGVSPAYAMYFLEPKAGKQNEAWRLVLPSHESTVAAFVYMCADEVYERLRYSNKDSVVNEEVSLVTKLEFLRQLRDKSYQVHWKEALFESVVALLQERSRLEVNAEGHAHGLGKERF